MIAATNQDIHELRAKKRFRNDLYYRLCSDIIELPTLRQRFEENQGELSILVERQIQRLIGTSSRRFDKMIEKKILECVPKGYAWPGNVRELEQCIRQIGLTGGYRPDPNPRSSSGNADFLTAVDKGSLSARNLMSSYCRLLYQRTRSFE
ncbi:MAG: sigma 54-interacting transcriptional regulator [Methylococcales bacterium]